MLFQTKEQAAAYLAGLIDGEGCITVSYRDNKEPMRRISIANTDRSIIDAALDACEMLGIYAGCYQRGPLGNKSEIWDVVIYGRKDFELVHEFVPIQSLRKQAKLLELLDSYKTGNAYKRWNEIDDQELATKYAEGYSSKELAIVYNCSPQSIMNWLAAMGIEKRTPGEQIALSKQRRKLQA